MRKQWMLALSVLILALTPTVVAAQGKGGGRGNGGGEDPPAGFDPSSHVILVDDGGPTAITDDGSGSVNLISLGKRTWWTAGDWSPPVIDGDWLVYTQYGPRAPEPGLHIVNLSDTQQDHHFQIDGFQPVWSPAGDWLAMPVFTGPDERGFQFVSVTGLADGVSPVVLASSPVSEGYSLIEHLSWSPDGGRIAATAFDLADVDVTGTDVRIWDYPNGLGGSTSVRSAYAAGALPKFISSPGWAKQSDGWMTIQVNEWGSEGGFEDVWFVDNTGACPPVPLLEDPDVYFRAPDWSASDDRLVLRIDDPAESSNTGLWVVALDIGPVTLPGGATVDPCVRGVDPSGLNRIGDWGGAPPRWRR
jgi:hypothetical protein